MNAYQEPQSSGIVWRIPPSQREFYIPSQNPPEKVEPRKATGIFENLEKQMADFTVSHEAELLEVRKHYLLASGSSVPDFLTQHRTISRLLLEAIPHLRAAFGADIILILKAPIDESGSQILYAVINWPGKSQEVRRAREQFDNLWWMTHAGQASGYLTFTYELA